MLCSEVQWVVYFLELTAQRDDLVEMVYERKKHTELREEAERQREEAEGQSRKVKTDAVSRGFVFFLLLTEVGIKGRSLKEARKNMADSPASSSEWLRVRRKLCDRGKDW